MSKGNRQHLARYDNSLADSLPSGKAEGWVLFRCPKRRDFSAAGHKQLVSLTSLVNATFLWETIADLFTIV